MLTTDAPTKSCRRCKRILTIQQFQTFTNGTVTRRRHSCIDCRNADSRKRAAAAPVRPERKQQMRAAMMIRQYGITLDEYQKMHEAQNGLCAICHRPETRTIRGEVRPLCVDHEHETGRVRGLLCSNCNVAIGFLDSEASLNSAIHYLRGD